jgi:hypothetical protein
MHTYRHAHILGLMSLAVASFGVTVGSELRTVAIMSGLLAVAAAATFANEKGLFTRPAKAATAGAPAAGRSTVQTKRLLMLMLAIGIVVYAGGGAGTFSSFSAETSNTNSSIASGTLAMSDNVNATTCLSNDAPSLDNYRASGCGVILSLANQAPGVFGGSAALTLNNTGSIDGSKLTVYAPYSNTTLSTQINSGTTITSLPINTLEGTIAVGDTIELDFGGQSIQMIAGQSAGVPAATYTPGMTTPANAIYVATPGSTSGTLTNGGATVSSITTTNIKAGMSVSGTGIPANTTVSSVSVSSIVLSQNATVGGAQTLTFTVKATTDFKVGTRVYDVSSNGVSGKTDCWDKITQTPPPVTGAKVGSDLNFNGTDIGDGSHWDSTNAYCKTALFWIQEQSNPTPAQSGTLNGTTAVTALANTALLSVGMSVSGTGIAQNTTIASITSATAIALSQAATGSGSQSLTFTANYCWTGQGSSGGTGTTPPVNQAGSTSNASTTITVANSALLSLGLNVTTTGTNVMPPNTAIVAITDATHVVLSQTPTATGSQTFAFTAANNMCYAPIGANLPVGTQNINSSTTSITFSAGLAGNIRTNDVVTISEPKKMVVTCTAGQDAYIGATTVKVSGCTSTANTWVAGTGETFDGSGATLPAVAATIVDTTVNNLLNSDTTDTISNFDTAHASTNQLELAALQTNGAHVPSGGGVSTVELAKHNSTGDTRIFYIGVYFPAGSGSAQNATQGLAANFGLSWNLQQ